MNCACSEDEDGGITGLCMAHHWAFCGNLIAELGDVHGALKIATEHSTSPEQLRGAMVIIGKWVKTWTPEKAGDATSKMWMDPIRIEEKA